MGLRAARAVCLLAAVAGLSSVAGAQPTDAPAGGVPSVAPSQAAPPGPVTVPWPAVTIDQAMAQVAPIPAHYDSWMLERIATLDLRLRAAPAPEDYQIAAWGLALAAEARDAGAGLWRKVVEAAFNAGDSALLERATREVVRLDPQDTLAQLRLITMRIGRLQTADARLGTYARLLGQGGSEGGSGGSSGGVASLDPSVRSRLALDAALLARETGDTDTFARYLSMATELDASNKEAATLALQFFQASVPDDPIGRLHLLSNLLMADPMDPHVHLAMSAELMSHGVFDWANRFHNDALTIVASEDREAAIRLDTRGLILSWQNEGPASVVDILERRLATLRHEAAVNVAQKEHLGLAIRDAERPENTRLEREYEVIRLMAADAAGRRDIAASSAADLAATALEVVKFFQRPENQPTGEAGRDLARRILDMWKECLVVRAWAGSDLPALGADIDQTIQSMGDASDFSEPIAWYALRTGRPGEVLEFFTKTKDTLYRSRVGLALTYEALGQRERAAEIYVQIARSDPTSVQSAWARSRLLFVTGQDQARTEWAPEAAVIASQVPIAVDRSLSDPMEFMRMQIATDVTRVGPFDLIQPRLVLANRGTLALGVGADRPFPSRFLLSPEVRVGGEPVIGGVQPEIFDFDQRLRLAPGQEMTATLWPDVGFTGLFMDSQSASRDGVAWRAIQGFRVVENSYTHGPMCLTDATGEIVREPLLASRLTPADLERAVREAPEEQLPRLARAVFAVTTTRSYAQNCSPEQGGALAAAMGERYRGADTATRRLLLGMLPPARLVEGFASFGDAVRSTISSETDPTLMMLALLTWAQTPDDPIIVACRACADPRVGAAAAIQAARLGAANAPTYSTSGPGIGMMIGPSLPTLGRLGQ